MLPFVRGDIRSRITRFEPDAYLEEDFEGGGMKGHLAYEFLAQGESTFLIQRETIVWQGCLKLCAPVIKPMLAKQLKARLVDIKAILESD